jgi:signal transduction histidine kinase
VLKLRSAAKDALGEMRLLIFELRPPVVAEEGLSAGLQARLDMVEKRSGIQTKFKDKGTGQLPPDVEDGLYRIAQEALNNVLKHAHACSVTVSLRHEAGGAVLEITDDGVGFESAVGAEYGGLGLHGMAERAEEMGARLTVDNDSGPGTRVSVVWGDVNG